MHALRCGCNISKAASGLPRWTEQGSTCVDGTDASPERLPPGVPEQEAHGLGSQLAHMAGAVAAQPGRLLQDPGHVRRQPLRQVPQDGGQAAEDVLQQLRLPVSACISDPDCTPV